MSEPTVALIGLPTDRASSFLRGAARGPAAIREALLSPASNLTTERGLDLSQEGLWHDLGDLAGLDGSDGEERRGSIEQAVARELAGKSRVLCLGGDHSVSYPILRAHRERHERLTVVQVDAHPDLYDRFEGDRYSHACPFARVMEEGLADRLVQLGIRTATGPQRAQAERFGVEIPERSDWLNLDALALEPPVYLSIDLDGLDPAFAPAVAHPEPGGLTTGEVLEIVWRVPGLIGADVVELNPWQDGARLSAATAAKLVKELLGRLAAPAADEGR